MQQVMESLVKDDSAFPDHLFDRDALRRAWQKQLDRLVLDSNLIDTVATFGLFQQAMAGHTKPETFCVSAAG